MRKNGLEFLDSWIEQNLTYLDRGGDFIRAMELAERCRREAASLGITIDESEAGIGVLEPIIHRAMHGKLDKSA